VHVHCLVLPSSLRSSFVVRRSSFVVRRSSFVVRRSSFVVRRSSFVVRRSSVVGRPSSFVLRPSSFVLRPSTFDLHPSFFVLVLRPSFHRSSPVLPLSSSDGDHETKASVVVVVVIVVDAVNGYCLGWVGLDMKHDSHFGECQSALHLHLAWERAHTTLGDSI
jgi:hypothetical protein